MARAIVYIDVTPPPLRSAFLNQLPERPLDFRKRRAKSRAPRVDHDIPLAADFGAMHPEGFPNAALDAVAHDRSADRSRHGESQAGGASRRVRTRQAKRCE